MKNDTIIKTDIPKHKKKRMSSLSRIKARTSHKHKYDDCLLISKLNGKGHIYKSKYCKICGKIQYVDIFESLTLSNKELRERHKGLKEFSVEDVFKQKYVTLSCKNTTEEA